jgi:hypothetical protein
MANEFHYESELKEAIRHFWQTRDSQSRMQKNKNVQDRGSRGAVTGGKQMDGFTQLLKKVSMDSGVPEEWIYTKGNELPGYFRPTKDWDLIIVKSNQKLISCFEFKSQVGPSFGNNFNNRTEEAIGSAVDIWTAYRKKVFPFQQQPWLGYLIVVEKCNKSTIPVKVREPHFQSLPEYKNGSYLDR